MTLGDYFKKNKKFATIGAIVVVVAVGGAYNVGKTQPVTSNTPQVVATATPVAGMSATLTPIATPSATMIPVAPGALCKAVALDPNNPQSVIPDPDCTPGTIDPNVTQANIATTICKAGYTATVRPTVSYTDNLKYQDLINYGYANTTAQAKAIAKNYELDHFIPLELGGNPSAPTNLWPEYDAGKIPNEKDKVETYLNKQVCNGSITLAGAQASIVTNWYKIYQSLVK